MHLSRSLLFALLSISSDRATAFTTTSWTSSPSRATTTVPQNNNCNHHRPIVGSRQFHLFSTANLEDEIKSMRVGAIKQELESYGISTRTFLEKSELVEALIAARKEGKTPVSNEATTSSASSSSSSSDTTTTASSSTVVETSSSAPTNPEERQQRIIEEQAKCKDMKVQELRSELESMGVSTKSFFEKSEFVRALAEARVDGVKKKSKKKKRRTVLVDDDEVEEVAAKVEVITNDNVGPKTKKSRDNDAGNASAGGNPFGGAGGGSPFGGMPFGGGAPGGMGGMDMNNIADMLKGMGGMGGGPGAAGGNPFAGAAGGGGANPFGGGAGMADAMKAAQQAMSNPKVQQVIQKAQKNPKVMQAVQECMSNPMAMSKYMSDPEVGPILKELQEAMM